ncbi:hypothetical protein CIPAW_10G055700 [Carya illinoinensis]|uniref:Uncharacterized protein n=1 Tax=Carya illinoinensis TaxID=32201 RepID=A0A8T1P2P9_CARIL|nr:hypothetical protein CIPAW_10G055700 [Carya illinoinensis]KAG6638747.1 hypothetical protein CIPAW_10G055700 [Carya illinoinensis]KAG6638748.1 hypothetical protein CIPAW_10G055700 [Carya illinoinensis]
MNPLHQCLPKEHGTMNGKPDKGLQDHFQDQPNSSLSLVFQKIFLYKICWFMLAGEGGWFSGLLELLMKSNLEGDSLASDMPSFVDDMC